MKRSFLIEEEILFSTRYRYAAFEDVEFGYRLNLRGMTLRYLATAIGYHLHEMTPESFIERQRKVGRMLTMMAIQRPGFVPNEHSTFLCALEMMRCHPPLASTPLLHKIDTEQFIQDLTKYYRSMLELAVFMNQPAGRPVVDTEREAWRVWLNKGGINVWEAINQAILRQGMAEEWAVRDEDRASACAWVQSILLPSIANFKGVDWNMPFARPEFSAFMFPSSQLAYKISKHLRSLPIIGPGVVQLEQSSFGQYLRGTIARIIR